MKPLRNSLNAASTFCVSFAVTLISILIFFPITPAVLSSMQLYKTSAKCGFRAGNQTPAWCWVLLNAGVFLVQVVVCRLFLHKITHPHYVILKSLSHPDFPTCQAWSCRVSSMWRMNHCSSSGVQVEKKNSLGCFINNQVYNSAGQIGCTCKTCGLGFLQA